MDTAHRSSRTPGGLALRSILLHDQHDSDTVPVVWDSYGAGFPLACRHPRHQTSPAVVRADALPHDLQAPLGLAMRGLAPPATRSAPKGLQGIEAGF
jgi:hypothetical protein